MTDPETGAVTTRQPRIITEENPPHDHEEALRRWRKARSAFRGALEKSRKTLKELARICGVSRTTVYNWRRAGLLPPAIKLGPNSVGFLSDQIQAFIASRPLA